MPEASARVSYWTWVDASCDFFADRFDELMITSITNQYVQRSDDGISSIGTTAYLSL